VLRRAGPRNQYNTGIPAGSGYFGGCPAYWNTLEVRSNAQGVIQSSITVRHVMRALVEILWPLVFFATGKITIIINDEAQARICLKLWPPCPGTPTLRYPLWCGPLIPWSLQFPPPYVTPLRISSYHKLAVVPLSYRAGDSVVSTTVNLRSHTNVKRHEYIMQLQYIGGHHLLIQLPPMICGLALYACDNVYSSLSLFSMRVRLQDGLSYCDVAA